MSDYSQPIYYFTNIGFNSAFYMSTNTALTYTQTSSLYLLKNTADTATAFREFYGFRTVGS